MSRFTRIVAYVAAVSAFVTGLAGVSAPPARANPGDVVEFSIPPGSQPEGIAPGPDGNLWFAEAAANKIGRISTKGKFAQFPIPTPSSSPQGIASGPDGNLWFVENSGNNVGRITTKGTITEFSIPTRCPLTSLSTPPASQHARSTAAAHDEIRCFDDSGKKIGRITTWGAITEFPIPTPNSLPHGIAPGPDGNLWFTEFVGDKIAR